MVASTENGRYLQTEVVPLEEYGDSEQSPKQSKGIANYRYLKVVKPEMLSAPYKLLGKDGYPDGMRSDEYVYERLKRILFKQLKLSSCQQAVDIMYDVWKYNISSTRQDKEEKLEQLRRKIEEDLAQVKVLEKELEAKA